MLLLVIIYFKQQDPAKGIALMPLVVRPDLMRAIVDTPIFGRVLTKFNLKMFVGVVIQPKREAVLTSTPSLVRNCCWKK